MLGISIKYRVVHKVTIVPRGRAGGYMIALPKEDQCFIPRGYERAVISKVSWAGRVAEEII